MEVPEEGASTQQRPVPSNRKSFTVPIVLVNSEIKKAKRYKKVGEKKRKRNKGKKTLVSKGEIPL